MSRSRFWSRVTAALVAVVAVATFAAATHAGEKPAGCGATVVVGVLPVWARAGFHDPKQRVPYVLGHAREIAGILFGRPLRSPPRGQGRANKILWVSRVPTTGGSDLRISAQRMTGSQAVGSPVERIVSGGPGPSIIDLPAAGCWRLSLGWSGRADTLDLRYITSR